MAAVRVQKQTLAGHYGEWWNQAALCRYGLLSTSGGTTSFAEHVLPQEGAIVKVRETFYEVFMADPTRDRVYMVPIA